VNLINNNLLVKRNLVHISQSSVRDESSTIVWRRRGDCIAILYQAQAMVWYSAVMLTRQ
jgi:hypothetical protein